MKKYIFFYLLITSLLYSLNIFASIEIRSVQMTTEDGIANNSIRYLLQDSKGYIWMGTQDGLSRYDGNSFVTFRPEAGNRVSLADYRIKILDEDRNGFLWIATSQEVYSCFDLKKDCFVDFTGCGEYKEPYSNKIIASNGDIWLWHKKNGCRRIRYQDNAFSSVVFKKEKGNLPFSSINYIVEDEDGSVWIGSDKGVAQVEGDKAVCADNSQKAYTAISHKKEVFFLSADGKITGKKSGKPAHWIAQLKMGDKSVVCGAFRLQNDWVILTSEGGFVFNFKGNTVNRSGKWDIKQGHIQTDNRGNTWIYNSTGKVWYVNIETSAVKTFQLMPADKVDFIDKERYYIVHDSRDIIWISTYGNGLFAYNPKNDELQHFTFDVNGLNHISSNSLLSIIEDRTGGIWVSSEYTGVSHISVVSSGAQRIFLEDNKLSDQENAIRMITRMSNGDTWISSRRGSIYTYDARMGVKPNKRNFNSNIYAMTEGPDGDIWLGSRGNGLCIDNKWYTTENSSISENNIYAIHRDSKNRMWVGTLGGGLNLAEKTKHGAYTFTRFLNDTYSQSRIRVIREDTNGWLWVGTSYGVYVFHPDSIIANPHDYSIYNYSNGHLRSNEIRSIIQDRKGDIWIASAGGGFCVCTPKGDYKNLSFEHFDTGNGLVNNMVQSIVEDKEGKLWIATEFGISRFEPDTKSFENFFFSTTALGNVYSENCACVSENGDILFGTNYGLIAITPSKIRGNAHVAPLVSFTDLLVNGSSMRLGDTDSPLDSAMAYTDEIELKYFQNAFVIKFSTFDYSDVGSTKYSYYLEPYDKEWSLPSSLNFASYKNLEPGNYKLHVKACNNNGKWSEVASILEIAVAPPFWQTPWALLIYAALLTTTLYITFRLMQNFNNLRNRIQVEKQLTEYKLVFFTNISHEFRTPLTLIQGGLEKIKTGSKTPKEMAYSIKIMDKSVQRMLRLINQLLEFRKMQNNKLALSLEETDVIAFLYEIFLSFKDTAESKKMDFKFLPSIETYKTFIDKGNLDKVTYNILSNAFKYTPTSGEVALSVKIDEPRKLLVISVADTGVGIPKEKRNELFKRFMQSNFSGNSVGIGLHLTHELVNAHKGNIAYTENPGGGSVFTVSLPTNAGVYEAKDFLIPHNVLLEEEARHKETQPTSTPEEECSLPAQPLNKRRILIIEDDNDIREFLQSEIGQYFEVAAENDGLSGLERARTYDADLIISDVLMPGLTGFEVTRQLKNNFETSHIPIILLTAMNSTDNHLEGVESGADAYITKPFSPKLLVTQVVKLIEQRDKLRDKFTKDPGMMHPSICTSNKDKEFVDKLQGIMQQHLDNDLLNVDDMATMMGLGRTVFYRKVRGLTGYSPNEYIRIIRMKKAAELLLEDRLTVSEISYKIGINDPLYFSKCFKQQFGVAPTVYRRTVLNQ